MLPFLSVTGILLSIIFVLFNYRKNHSSIFLSLFFFSLSAYSLTYYILFSSNSVKLVALLLNLNVGFLMLLTGPAFYFYIRSVLTDQIKLKWSDVWHLIPIIIFIVIGFRGVFIPWEQKIQFATEYLQNNKMIVSYYNKSVNDSSFFLIGFFFRPAYVLAYLISSVLLLVKHRKLKVYKHVFENQKFMYVWLSILFFLLFILILSHTTVLYVNYFGDKLLLNRFFNIVQTVTFVGLTGLIFSPFFFPEILYGMPRIPQPFTLQISDETALTENKKQPSEFEKDYLLLIKHKVELCMSDLQPYLQSDCNLAYFAKLVKLPAHHLAYYFREEQKQPFNDYRNEWRVKHAKKLISEGKTSELTLEAIGLISGFSSRNAFFTAFKKSEKITPSAFASNFVN